MEEEEEERSGVRKQGDGAGGDGGGGEEAVATGVEAEVAVGAAEAGGDTAERVPAEPGECSSKHVLHVLLGQSVHDQPPAAAPRS